jgi:hypothetical protein
MQQCQKHYGIRFACFFKSQHIAIAFIIISSPRCAHTLWEG